MNKPQDLLSLAKAALQYAQTVADTAHCKDVLDASYGAWRIRTQTFEYIPRHGDAWNAMMLATAGEYQKLRNAKSREWRAKQNLLAQAKRWECK